MNRTMQRALFLFLTVTLLLSMSGCIIIPVSKRCSISADDVASIQFYDLRNDEADHQPGFYMVHEPVCTLTEEDHEAFLKDFSRLKFSDTIIITVAAIDPSFYYGDWVVRINFTDGTYTFYSSGGYSETHDASGKTITCNHFSCNADKLQKLIAKYYSIG